MISETASATIARTGAVSPDSSLLAGALQPWRGRRHNFWQWVHAWHRLGVGGAGAGAGDIHATETDLL